MPPFFMNKINRLFGLLSLFFLVVAYTYPFHLAPWRTFYNEWFFAIFVLIATIYIGRSGAAAFVKFIPWLFLIFIVIAHFYVFVGQLVLFDHLIQLVLFLIVGYFSYVLGVSIRNQELFVPFLLALCFAGLISVFVAIYQWLGQATGLGWQFGLLLPWNSGGRLVSNIGQANNFGMLMVVCLWATYAIRESCENKLNFPLFILIVTLWVIGLYLSGSRTALLNLLIAVLAAGVYAKNRGLPRPWIVVLPIIIYGLCVVLNQAYIFLYEEPLAIGMRSMASDPGRLKLWRFGFDAMAEYIWSGAGQGSLPRLYFERSLVYGSIDESIPGHVHNTVLDIFLAHGIVVGGLLVGFFVYRVIKAYVACREMSDFWLFLVILGLCVHAMLEYPLNYGFFFWLFCLFLGLCMACDPVLKKSVSLSFNRGIVASAVLGLLIAGWVWVEYVKVESLYTKARNNNLGLIEISSLRDQARQQIFPGLIVGLYWSVYRVSDKIGEIDLVELETVAGYKPFPELLFKVAVANAFLGKSDRALWWLERLCSMFPSQISQVEEAWQSVGRSKDGWPSVDWMLWSAVYVK